VIYGDRDYELLKIAEHEPFGLYVEGAPYPFTPANIHRRLHSKFYQRLNAPLIWLRLLKRLNQALLVATDPAGARAVAAAFQKVWEGCPTPVQLALVSGASEALTKAVEQGRDQLATAGCSATIMEVPAGPDRGPAPEATSDFGLVAVALEKGVKKESPKLQWLSQIKAPLMLVLY
jgi:hypothetical protein